MDQWGCTHVFCAMASVNQELDCSDQLRRDISLFGRGDEKTLNRVSLEKSWSKQFGDIARQYLGRIQSAVTLKSPRALPPHITVPHTVHTATEWQTQRLGKFVSLASQPGGLILSLW